MIFYNCKLNFKLRKNSKILAAQEDTRNSFHALREKAEEINNILYEEWPSGQVMLMVYRASLTEFSLLAAVNGPAAAKPENVTALFKDMVAKKYGLSGVKAGALTEITPKQAGELLSCSPAYWPDNFHSLSNDYFDLDYYRNRTFKIEEYLIPETALTYQKAVDEAGKVMADATLLEELERIYDKNHPQVFMGHPVHYKISAGDSHSARQIVDFLTKALYANHRLTGRTVSRIYEINENCYDESDLTNIFKQSAGNTIIIELIGSKEEHQNYASCYERVVNFIGELIRQHQRDTLFFLVETTGNPGFSPRLISDLQEDLYLIEIKEGKSSRSDALKYLQNLFSQAGLSAYDDQELQEALGDKTTFRPSDIYNVYETLYQGSLRNKSYTAYKQVSRLMVARRDMSGKDAYKELSEMIGLKSVKDIVGQILAAFRVQKIRSSMGLEQQKTSMHMVFTGNPGSAKTTVARLFAEILSDEGILETGEFIECGRAELVGKYVGWTAPAVKRQFKLAKGGVLFIDEAYSLVDDRDGSYGDEAISAIVQEMENRRHDTIVIFAGYPDKMKAFLDKNEGLKSRIAFHVDFPDYGADELLDILTLMAGRKGFELSAEVKEKCRGIFAEACRQKDFGNGRFARNLLEQALLKQAQRLMAEHEGKEIGKKEILSLMPEDFDVNAAEHGEKPQRSLGFRSRRD